MSKWLTLKRLEEMCEEARIEGKKDDHYIETFNHDSEDWYIIYEEDLTV